jgi:hypothetical protein
MAQSVEFLPISMKPSSNPSITKKRKKKKNPKKDATRRVDK